MSKFSDKVNGNQVSADEYNNVTRALKNSIEDSGQSIDASNIQTSKSMANNAAVATFYTDSGAADVYVLSSIDSFKGLTKLIDGAQARFRTVNVNTGASTINVAGTGVRAIKLLNGTSDPLAGDISITEDTTIRYDLVNNAWLLQPRTAASTSIKGLSLLPKPVTIANNAGDAAHDIDFGAGNIQFNDGSGQAVASALTKRADVTFAVGDNVGGMASGESLPASGTIHCFGLSSPDGTTTDFGFDTDVNATNLLADGVVSGAGLTKFELIESFRTNGSNNIKAFTQVGKSIILRDPILDIDTTNPGTARVLDGLTVPAGRNVKAKMNAWYFEGSSNDIGMRIENPDVTDRAVSITTSGLPNVGTNVAGDAGSASPLEIVTNTSSQIAYTVQVSDASTIVRIVATGWESVDLR